MQDSPKKFIIQVIYSFKHAFRGISLSFGERNMKIHIITVALVTIAGVVFNISLSEWIAVLICFAVVLSLEMVNTAIEGICDKLRDDLKLSYNSTRDIRDLASGAVLIAVIPSILIGIVIFLPKILDTLFA